MEKKTVSHITPGLIVGAVGIILFLTYYFNGLSFLTNFIAWIPSLVTIALVVFFVLQYGKANNNNVTFGMLFGFGFRVTIIYTLLMIAFLFLVFYIFPDYKVQYLEAMANQADMNKNVNEEQKEVSLSFMNKHFKLFMVAGALFVCLLTGTVASLIGAVAAKKNPVTPFDNQMQ